MGVCEDDTEHSTLLLLHQLLPPSIKRIAMGLSKDWYVLKLYITGQSRLSEQAVENLTRLCEVYLQNNYNLEIIDLLEHPEWAERRRILATPAVIRDHPEPIRMVVGDLSDHEKVLLGLDLKPTPPAEDLQGEDK